MTFKQLRPFAIVAVVVLAVVGFTVLAGGDDGEGSGSEGSSPENGDAAANEAAGIGSDAALANPDCDSETGRLAISFVDRPQCVMPFEEGADNGGATSAGVTADSIKVVYYAAQQQATESSDEELLRDYQTSLEPFEHFYETWGRHVELVVVKPTGVDEVAQRADAIAIANEHPFAVVGVSGASEIMQSELASRGIVVATINPRVEVTQQLEPNLWGIGGNGDQGLMLTIADYVGERLLGQPAEHAGDDAYRTTERRVGIVYPSRWHIATFTDQFASHGGEVVEAISYESGDTASFAERSRVVAARLKEAGVTSVIAATDFSFTGALLAGATSQDYFPEWIMTGYSGQDISVFARGWDQDQWSHAFGLTGGSMGGIWNDEHTASPEFQFYRWYHGNTELIQSDFHSYVLWLYTGIHGAGPELTPESFRDGLFDLPASGGAATGGVMSSQLSWGTQAGFDWTDYNGTEDYVEIYWDSAAAGRDIRSGVEATGHYRYVNGGHRFLRGDWPDGDTVFFDPTDAPIRYDEYPPGDVPPDFPCTGCPSQG